MDKIVKMVADQLGVEFSDLIGPSREISMVYGRYFVIKYLEDHLRLDNISIGRLINRDRTTVIASRNTIDNLMRYNRDFRSQYVIMETILLKSL